MKTKTQLKSMSVCHRLGASRRAAAGFTLIELLVVIAIIAILAAILLPVLTAAQRRAQTVQCLSNLKQMTMATFTYLQDNGSIGYPGAAETWLNEMQPYIANSDKVRVCPVANQPISPTGGAPGDAAHLYTWGGMVNANVPLSLVTNACSYTINGWLYIPSGGEEWVPDIPVGSYFGTMTAIRQPTQTPLFADGIWADAWPDNTLVLTDPASQGGVANLYTGYGGLTSPGTPGAGPIGRILIDRHGGVAPGGAPRAASPANPLPGAINMGFADGHVENVKLFNLWSFMWCAKSAPRGQPTH